MKSVTTKPEAEAIYNGIKNSIQREGKALTQVEKANERIKVIEFLKFACDIYIDNGYKEGIIDSINEHRSN